MSDLNDRDLEQDQLEHALWQIQRLVETGYLIRHSDGRLSSAPFTESFLLENMRDAE